MRKKYSKPTMTLTDSSANQQFVALQETIENLANKGASKFEPALFKYIESMSHKASTLDSQVKALVENKALNALSVYMARFSQAEIQARNCVENILITHPELMEELNEYLQQGNFKAIEYYDAAIARSAKPSAINQLLERLNQSSLPVKTSSVSTTLSERLQQQESTINDNFETSPTTPVQNQSELTSIEQFKRSLDQLNTEKFINHVVNEVPENPGPLNAHMLVIKALSSMQDISPDYLRRLVDYLDSLFWLDKAGKNLKKP